MAETVAATPAHRHSGSLRARTNSCQRATLAAPEDPVVDDFHVGAGDAARKMNDGDGLARGGGEFKHATCRQIAAPWTLGLRDRDEDSSSIPFPCKHRPADDAAAICQISLLLLALRLERRQLPLDAIREVPILLLRLVGA